MIPTSPPPPSAGDRLQVEEIPSGVRVILPHEGGTWGLVFTRVLFVLSLLLIPLPLPCCGLVLGGPPDGFPLGSDGWFLCGCGLLGGPVLGAFGLYWTTTLSPRVEATITPSTLQISWMKVWDEQTLVWQRADLRALGEFDCKLWITTENQADCVRATRHHSDAVALAALLRRLLNLPEVLPVLGSGLPVTASASDRPTQEVLLFVRPQKLWIVGRIPPYAILMFLATDTPPFLGWRPVLSDRLIWICPLEMQLESAGESGTLRINPLGSKFSLTIFAEDGFALAEAVNRFWAPPDLSADLS